MITNLINFFQRIYAENPSVAAILGVSSAGIVTSIVYICRSRIQSFFYWIKKQFTTTFLITNDGGTSEVYGLILKWLKKYNKLYTRSLTAPQQLDVDELSRDKISDALQYGLGRHLIWFHRQPIWLHIYEEKLENSRERKLYLSMSIIGRSHNLIYDLLDEVYKWNKNEQIEANKDKTRVNIYGYSGIDSWEIIRKRGFDTIYLSSKIEAEIKHNIQKFLDNEKIYVQHGIPYHYGMIFYGPPGTGKTSIIKAIASEFDFDISLIDPLKFDITRLREKKENDKIKLLVIEDIDLLLGTKRETVEDIEIDEEEDIIGIIENKKIKYDVKIPRFYFNKEVDFLKDEDGIKYRLIYTEKDNLSVFIDDIRKKIIGIRDYTIRGAERTLDNLLFYCNEDGDYLYFSYYKSDDNNNEELEYDAKILKLYFENRSIEAIKDDNGLEYVALATGDNSRDYLTILRNKDTFIQSMVDISKCGGTYKEENNLYYCGEDEEYFYFKYQNKIEENDYIKFSKNQLLIDCKQFAGKIYSESDDKEYDLVQCEDYVPHSIEALIGGLADGIISLSYTEFDGSQPIYYHLHYKYDDDEYIYFYQKKCIFKDGLLTSDYDEQNEENIEPTYDIKMPIGVLEEMFKKRHRVYSFLVHNDYVGQHDDKIENLDSLKLHKLYLWDMIKDKVYEYSGEDEYHFYFIYSNVGQQQPRCFLSTPIDNGYIEGYNPNYDLKFTEEELYRLIEKSKSKVKATDDNIPYSLTCNKELMYKKCYDGININDIRSTNCGIIDIKESKEQGKWVVYTYEEEDDNYFYFNYSHKLSAEINDIVSQPPIEVNEKPMDDEYPTIEENDRLELTEEKLTEVLQSKNKRYTTFESASACLVGSPINGIRTGEIGIIDKKISVEAKEWKVYTYSNEDEKRFYFEYSLKLSAEANDVLPEWRMRHALKEYENGFNNHIEEYKHYDLRIPLNEIEEILARESRLYYTGLLTLLTEKDAKNINNIRNKKMYIVSKITYMVYSYSYEDEDYFYFDRDLKEHRRLLKDYGLSQIITPTSIKQEEQNYDYSIPINILEGTSWEKPFATNEGDNLYIWMSGYNNPIDDIPPQGIQFVRNLIAENLYFYDSPKDNNSTKTYRYISHDDNNIYLKEIVNYQRPQITKGDPFGEELEVAKPTDSKKPAPVEPRPKTKVIKSGKDAAGKKVLRDLMNAIDGLITKENFIIIATTNSIESLDPALIRPGRFDTAIKIDYIDMEVFNKAMMRYFGKTVEGTLKKKNLTISRLQVEFLMGKTYEDFIKKYVRQQYEI